MISITSSHRIQILPNVSDVDKCKNLSCFTTRYTTRWVWAVAKHPVNWAVPQDFRVSHACRHSKRHQWDYFEERWFIEQTSEGNQAQPPIEACLPRVAPRCMFWRPFKGFDRLSLSDLSGLVWKGIYGMVICLSFLSLWPYSGDFSSRLSAFGNPNCIKCAMPIVNCYYSLI